MTPKRNNRTINKHDKQNKYLGVELFKNLGQVQYSLYVISIITKADPVAK